jgi:hypothetical protein
MVLAAAKINQYHDTRLCIPFDRIRVNILLVALASMSFRFTLVRIQVRRLQYFRAIKTGRVLCGSFVTAVRGLLYYYDTGPEGLDVSRSRSYYRSGLSVYWALV